jgi:hypothetical protein
MPREPEPLTLSAVVRRAAEVVDPEGEDSAVGALERHFEDDDQPITAIDTLELRLAARAEWKADPPDGGDMADRAGRGGVRPARLRRAT